MKFQKNKNQKIRILMNLLNNLNYFKKKILFLMMTKKINNLKKIRNKKLNKQFNFIFKIKKI